MCVEHVVEMRVNYAARKRVVFGLRLKTSKIQILSVLGEPSVVGEAGAKVLQSINSFCTAWPFFMRYKSRYPRDADADADSNADDPTLLS